MPQFDFNLFYERNLPHYQPPGATFFITFRLAGSLPKEVMERLEQEKQHLEVFLNKKSNNSPTKNEIIRASQDLFIRWDGLLDTSKSSPSWLSENSIAAIIENCLKSLDGKYYSLDGYCIMPNHVHLLITPLLMANRYMSLPKIMQIIKGSTAFLANKLLARRGQFWQHESYDHVVRDNEDLGRIIDYVLENPRKAGLPKKWTFSRFESDRREQFLD